jgi:hypothetical protein
MHTSKVINIAPVLLLAILIPMAAASGTTSKTNPPEPLSAGLFRSA